MQRRLLLLVCFIFLLGGIQHANAQRKTATAQAATYVQGKVRVKLQPEVVQRLSSGVLPQGSNAITPSSKSKYVQTGITQFDRVSQQVKAVRMQRVFPYAGKNEARHKQYGLDLWYDITFEESSMQAAQVSSLYKGVPGVLVAQRIPVYQPIGGERFSAVSPTVAAIASGETKTALPFNDPLLGSQWHYYNDGSLSGAKAGADINVFPAWASGVTGSQDVVVAIIDGGFQTDHPDLKDNVWINEAELNGQPGVDDDNDGYVDDIYGYNFVTNSSDISAHSHGTHVAGTVGATNGNGIGVCGVAGGTGGKGGVKMMVCQVFDSRTDTEADFANALVYAADHGASIAQCSWGNASAGVTDEAIETAVRYFTTHGGGDKMSGGLCIFAAGNNGSEGDYYPGCMDEVVAVGAMDCTGGPASYSNYGTWVDVTAPGGDEDFGEKYGVLSTLPNSTYGYNEGTSMATPHVSGIAALVLSKFGNANFSNETLRTLLTSSVNELDYTNYPDHVGKMGTGAIDTYKALQGEEGATPDKVSDFTLTPSHDNVLVEWTIPASGNEGMIDHHVIYYSTEPFANTDNLTKLNSVNVDTKFKSSGDAMSYELTGLKATTTYYFAIVAYNRWGKASEVSEVKSATTNAGPVAKLDKSSVSMKVNAATSTVGEADFSISNTGEGVLKYELSSATKSVRYATSSRNVKPQPGKLVAYSGKIQMAEAGKSHTVVSADYDAEDWPQSMTWSKSIYAYLGDEDKTLPNAQAQYFTVDADSFPNGFNLTALNFQGAYGSNPEIEIYDGSRSISAATLLTKVDYSYFAYNYDINLSEQLYFEPGASFWVVAKFPAGQTNPLGAGLANTTGISQYSFISTDEGKTWTQLSEAVKGGSFESYADKLTWAITCKSKNPDWSAVLNPDPKSGEVRAGESQKVTLKNDGQTLVNGTYNFNVHLSTNEAEKTDNKVAVTMTVSGNKPVISSQKLVDFGSLLVGQTKTVSVELVNSGYGVFAGRYGGGYTPSSSNAQFTCPSSYAVSGISARSKSTLDVTFAPTEAGDHTGTITLKDKDGNTYSFVVRGVASEPARLSITPESHDFGNLEVGGESKTATFTIKNEGKYPLQYVFPKFSSEKIEGQVAKSHKFGYTYLTNFDGSTDVVYEAAPELADEVDITSQFDDNTWQSEAIPVGFQFPFYGDNYDQVHVTSYGGIAMNTITGGIGCFVPEPSCMSGLGYISGFGGSGTFLKSASTKISYGHKDGNFVVKFKDVLTYDNNGDTYALSFHMVLSPDGSAAVYYDDYDITKARDGGALVYVGVVDADLTDPFTVVDENTYYDSNYTDMTYENFKTGGAVKIVAPSKSMIKSVSPADGYVGIGSSQEVTVTVAANDSLYAGALTNYLILQTNDPDNASKNLTLTANITGDGLVPEIKLDSTSVDFGNVFRTSEQKRTVSLANTGKDTMTVTGISFGSTDSKFSVDADLADGFTVAAGNAKDIVISVATETSGSLSDVLTITFSDGTKKTIDLKATVIGTPTVGIDPENIEETTGYGEDVDTTLTFSNSGDEPLTVSVEPDSWFTFSDVTADGQTASVDYTFKSSLDGFDVPFEWQDITSDYTEHMPYAYFINQTDYKEVELPFEFPFYGKKYKKMYIYDTGFVSFSKAKEDYKEFPAPPTQLPSKDTFYGNIIAPYWGNHTMATASSAGVFYKAEADRVIVSYKNYGNSAMSGMNFQVILNADGTFKFQYKLDDTGMYYQAFGLNGIMDETFTKGVTPGDRYIASGNATEWRPVVTYTVEPNAKVEIPVTIKADKLADTYTYQFNVTTNDPQNASTTIPVALTVTGDADAVFPEAVEVEEVYSENYETYYKEFVVKNNGTKAFTITNVSSPLFEMDYDTWSQEAMLQVEDGKFSESSDDGGWDDGGIVLGSVSPQADNVQWVSYNSGYSSPIVVGMDSIRFRVALSNTSSVHETSGDITFTLEGLDETEKVVPLKINITNAPAMTFDKDSILVVNADDNSKGEQTMKISNDGEYKLKYSFRLDPSGADEVESDGSDEGGGAVPAVYAPEASYAKGIVANSLTASALKTSGIKPSSAYAWDLPSDFTGTNSLYYPIITPQSSAQAAIMGTGSSDLESNYYAATQFTAPAKGFNLSHLYFVGTVGTLENVDIEAYVVKGDDVANNDNIVTRGKVHVDSEEPNSKGVYSMPRVIKFKHPAFFNEGEKFYIVVKYPAGYAANATMVSKDGDKAPNRYMGYLKSMGGWFDVEEYIDSYYSYGAFGYFMTACEEEPGESWVKLLTSETSGEIAVGESLEVKFDVDASKTKVTNQKATLVIKSNDPSQKLVNYHIVLNRNAAPAITVPENVYTVKEAATATLPVTISDPDGDAFTVALTSADGIASIESYSPTEGVTESDGVLSVAAGTTLTLNVKLAPDYETAGKHTFDLAVADANSNDEEETVTYNVEHTNRAPEYKGATEVALVKGANSETFQFASLFSDADGDEMTFSVSSADESVAAVFSSSTGFIINGAAEGTTTLTITATDVNGDKTEATVTVSVASASGINGVTADGKTAVSDITSDGQLSVTIGEAADKLTLTVYANGGQTLARQELTHVSAGQTVTLDLGNAPTGVYTLSVNADGRVSVAKLVKRQ